MLDFPNGSKNDRAVDFELTKMLKNVNLSATPEVKDDDTTIAQAAYILCSVVLGNLDLETRNDMIAKFYSELPGLINRVRVDSEITKDNMHIFVVNNPDFTFFFLSGFEKFLK